MACTAVTVVAMVLYVSGWVGGAPASSPAAGTGAATASSAPAGPAPKIRIDEKLYNFGEIWDGDKVEHDFIVHNDGDAELVLTSVRAGCGCTATNSDKTIGPGKQGKIHVAFNTTGKGSTPRTFIYVHSNDPVNGRIDLRMEGSAKKKIDIQPRAGFNFGRVKDNKVEPITVTVTSNLAEPFKPALQPLGQRAEMFKTDLKEVKPGKEYQITVAPQPPFTEGATNASLVLKTGTSVMPTINLPINIFVPPLIEISQTMIVLGAPPPRDLTYRIEVTYNGQGELKLLSTACTDPKVKTSVLDVTPGRQYRVVCEFPAGYNLENGQDAEIKIETDNTARKEIVIPVTMRLAGRPSKASTEAPRPAAADGPAIDISVAPIALGKHRPGEEVTQEVFFRNGGSKPLEIKRITASEGSTIEPNHTATVAPGAAGTARVKVVVPKQPGPFARTVTIESNDPRRPRVSVSLTGAARSYFEYEPAAGADFSNRRAAHAIPRVIKLEYHGEGEVKYLKAESSSPKFRAELEPIPESKLARLVVTALPPFEPGNNSGAIRVTTNNPLQQVVEIPCNLFMPQRLAVEPGSVLFLKNEKRVQKKGIVISNNGDKPINILAVERSNPKLMTQFFPEADGLSYQLHVSVPIDFEPSPSGEKVVLKTDDPEHKEIVIPIVFKTVQELVPR